MRLQFFPPVLCDEFFFIMGFKSKRSVSSKDKNLKHGIHANSTNAHRNNRKQKNIITHKQKTYNNAYVTLTRQRQGGKPDDISKFLVDRSSNGPACDVIESTASSPLSLFPSVSSASSSSSSSHATETESSSPSFTASSPDTRRGRSAKKTTQPVGRPTNSGQAMTAEELAARKKLLYEQEKKRQKVSLARAEAARRRWHTEHFVDEDSASDDERGGGERGAGDGGEDTVEMRERNISASCATETPEGGDGDGGGRGGGGDEVAIDEVELLDIQSQATGGEFDDGVELDTSDGVGKSRSSKCRAKEDFFSHLENHDELEQFDILRKICSKLNMRGQTVPGIEIESKHSKLVSKLTKRQVGYAADKILEQARKKKSLGYWLPTFVLDQMKELKVHLTRSVNHTMEEQLDLKFFG